MNFLLGYYFRKVDEEAARKLEAFTQRSLVNSGQRYGRGSVGIQLGRILTKADIAKQKEKFLRIVEPFLA